MVKYSDAEIDDLINEPKPLLSNWKSKIKLQEGRGSKQRSFEIEGKNGNKFLLILRQSNFNQLDFSIILGVYLSSSNKVFHLKRYDGKSHEHTNPIEKNRFYDFHIHTATERYQNYGNGE
ncbi:hypothetical protein H6G41_03850 [Tolypothrix sp. FACHB-123]|uniref:DUF6978 family protein n=1 Tax=Tolypothrix sp. FACHB-123 TaxID=2692868 RepID=UPI0016864000|nr:hypothetical protein [Tolypothrix sp. FACHB-123]MBD2353766.1 hypothetical protein [Tolypothrix sp. FACHB-123]